MGNALGLVTLGVPLRRGRSRTDYLHLDRFLIDAAAPLTSPRTAEPGPGIATLQDAESKLSISGGKLVISGGNASPLYYNPGYFGESRAQVAGRACLANLVVTGAGHLRGGWNAGLTGTGTHAWWIPAAGNVLYSVDAQAEVGSFSVGTEYQLAQVLRGTGSFLLIKGGTYTDWTLLWVVPNNPAAGPYRPWVGSHSAALTVDEFRVRDLTGAWATDYGIATDRLAAPTGNGPLSHEANCLVEWTQAALPSSGTSAIRFRTQAYGTDYWLAEVNTAGDLILSEVAGGVATVRATAAGVVAAGHRIVVVASGSVIRAYSNNVLRWTYSSASAYQSSTGATFDPGIGATVTNVIAWPRTVTLPGE